VLDTSSLHISINNWHKNPLTHHIVKRELIFAVDSDGGLIDEWKKTCGVEIVKQLLIIWEPYGGIVTYKLNTKIPNTINNALRRLGFKGTIDRLILKIAVQTNDKKIISDDKDFWNPRDTKSLGVHNSIVAQFLLNNLSIEVFILDEIIDRLPTVRIKS